MSRAVEAALEAALPTIDATVRRRLEQYVVLLARRNLALNLTAARSAEAYVEHVRDSLSLVSLARGPLIDVGSGGGFPAIPLAIAGGMAVTLVESVAKKARFLQEAVDVLRLPAGIVTERAELAARRPDLREAFASATARAVGPAPTVLELTVPFLRVGGMALLQRGTLAPREREALADAANILGAEIVEERVEDGASADVNEGRRLIVVRKTAATANRFPRRPGVPAKRPLCFEGPP